MATDRPAVDEQVLVVHRHEFFDGDWPQGMFGLADHQARDWIQEFEAAAFFVPRSAAETDPSLKQLIPYCLVTGNLGSDIPVSGGLVRRDGQGCDSILCVRRLRASTEGRLHGLYSVGIGGHIGPEDLADDGATHGTVERALWRELNEELDLPTGQAQDVVACGLLNDDGNPVGAVHVGLVFRLAVPALATDPLLAESVRIRETSKLEGRFRPLVEVFNLWQDPGAFETWSRDLLGALIFPALREEETTRQKKTH